MRGARKLVPQPCHHDNALEFLPALAHCVKAFGVTLTRTGVASRHRIFLSTSPPDWGNLFKSSSTLGAGGPVLSLVLS